MYYYCDESGEVCGPNTFAQIEEWVTSGKLPPETFLQHVEADEWVSYEESASGVEAPPQKGYLDDDAVPIQTVNTSFESETLYGSQQTSKWEDTQWHYVDDNGEIQGPYNTQTIGAWYDVGALGLDRYVSIDGADWVKLSESAPFLALWSKPSDGLDHLDRDTVSPGSHDLQIESDTKPTTRQRRQSIKMAAKRCQQRRSSMNASSNREQSELAKKLTSQKSMLRKTVGLNGRPSALPRKGSGRQVGGKNRVNTRQKSTHMSHLMKGLEVRRTIITRGKKRRSSIVTSALPVFKMADGSEVPEAQASAINSRVGHRRRTSIFSEDDESDEDWLSD